MPDATVPITPGSGANVDVAQLTRADGTLVDRQRMVVSSDSNVFPGNAAAVSDGAVATADAETRMLLRVLIHEVRMLRRSFDGWTDRDVGSDNAFDTDAALYGGTE